MGFPVGYTAPCLPKSKQKGTEYSDVRHTLIGNSWHVPVVAWLLKELFAPLGLTKLRTVHDVVLGSSPGADQTLQGYLRRLPLRPVRNKEAEAPECQLGKKLINFVAVKGEDLLLQALSVGTMKFHRLRASVQSKLWRWRVVPDESDF